MFHVFVSYSSANREVAEQFVRDLTSRDLSVWMDDADAERGDTAMGVPAGTRWRDSIRDGVDASLLVVILDSPTWRTSAACRWEYSLALAAGKRTAVVPVAVDEGEGDSPAATVERPAGTGAVDWVAVLAAEHEDVAQAHSRLLRIEQDDRTGVLARWFGHADAADDVATVLGAQLAPIGLSLTDRHRSVIEPTLAAEAARRTRVRTARVAALTMVALLTVAAMISGVVAFQANGRSQQERRHQVSVLSAGEAVAARTSEESREALERGSEAADTVALAAAAQVVASRDKDSEVLYSGVRNPTGVAISDDGQTIVVTERQHLTVLRADRGPVRIEAPERIGRAGVTLAGDGTVATFLGGFTDGKWAHQYDLDVDSGRIDQVDGLFLDAHREAEGTTLAAAYGGAILRDGRVVDHGAAFDSPPVAVTTTPDGLAVLLDNGHIALSDSAAPDGLRVVDRFAKGRLGGVAGSPEATANAMSELAPEAVEVGESGKERTAPARIMICGDQVIAWDRGTVRTVRFDGREATRTRVATLLDSDASRACFRGHGLFRSGRANHLMSIPAGGEVPRSVLRDNAHAGLVPLASSPNGEWIVAARVDGMVVRAPAATTARTFEDDETFLFLPSDAGRLAIAKDGGVRLDGRSIGDQRLPRLLARRVATVDNGFWIPAGRWILKVSERGVERRTAIREEIGVVSARVASDGSIVATGESAVVTVDQGTDSYRATPVVLDDAAGVVLDADVLDEESLVVLTSEGRLLRVDAETGEVTTERRVSAGGQTGAVTVLDDGRILTMASDGVLRETTPDFEQARTLQLRGGAAQIEILGGRDRVLVAGVKLGAVIVDVDDLVVTDVVDPTDGSSQAVVLSPDGTRMVTSQHWGTNVEGERGIATRSIERFLPSGPAAPR